MAKLKKVILQWIRQNEKQICLEENSEEKDRLTHRSHLVVEDVGTLQDLVIFPVAQTCWVQRGVFNSTFGRRRGT